MQGANNAPSSFFFQFADNSYFIMEREINQVG